MVKRKSRNVSVRRIDQQTQTELEPETELFELIVFEIDLLEFVEDRMPQTLDTICKLVISPTAVLQDAIIDPRSALCDGDIDWKSTQTAKCPNRSLIMKLISDSAIYEAIRNKNQALAVELKRIYFSAPKFSDYINIAPGSASVLVGREGKNIKSINLSSGANCQVLQDGKTVRITADNPDKIMRAVCLINECMEGLREREEYMRDHRHQAQKSNKNKRHKDFAKKQRSRKLRF